MLFEIVVLRNFALLTEKQLCWSLSCEYCKISKKHFFYRTLLMAASELKSNINIVSVALFNAVNKLVV